MKKDNSVWRMEFASRLRESIEKSGMNYTDLSKLTGIGKSDITNYCRGKYMPKQDRVFIMAQALGVDPVWLYALDVKYRMEALQNVATPEEAMAYLTDGGEKQVVSTSVWNPDELFENQEDESFHIMARGMHRMTPEKRKKLIDMCRVVFAEDFDEEGNKK